jgi:hypothetical protein
MELRIKGSDDDLVTDKVLRPLNFQCITRAETAIA